MIEPFDQKIKISIWALELFLIQGFISVFNFSDQLKFMKRCLNALTPNLNLMWGWSLLINLGLFGRFKCNSVGQEVKTQSIETVKLRFLYLSRVDFLEINVFYSIFEHISKSFIFVFSYNSSLYLLHFPSKLLRFKSQGRK